MLSEPVVLTVAAMSSGATHLMYGIQRRIMICQAVPGAPDATWPIARLMPISLGSMPSIE